MYRTTDFVYYYQTMRVWLDFREAKWYNYTVRDYLERYGTEYEIEFALQ